MNLAQLILGLLLFLVWLMSVYFYRKYREEYGGFSLGCLITGITAGVIGLLINVHVGIGLAWMLVVLEGIVLYYTITQGK